MPVLNGKEEGVRKKKSDFSNPKNSYLRSKEGPHGSGQLKDHVGNLRRTSLLFHMHRYVFS